MGYDAQTAWTGTKLLVWGGSERPQQGPVISSLTAFDPATNSWKTLAPPPTGGTGVWTGTELVVWNGRDGAAYHPDTDTWRELPPAPLPRSIHPTVLSVGDEVVVIAPESAASSPGAPIAVAAYEPATDTWRKLPPVPAPPGNPMQPVQAVAAGNTVVAFEEWTHTSDAAHASPAAITSGTAVFELDTATEQWKAAPEGSGSPASGAGGLGIGVLDPVSAGSQIAVLVWTHFCPACEQTQRGSLLPFRFDPVSGGWQQMASASVDTPLSKAVWTGRALVRFNPRYPQQSPVDAQIMLPREPGDVEAWDPAANAWTAVPAPPGTTRLPQPVWTGSELLAWARPDGGRPMLYRLVTSGRSS